MKGYASLWYKTLRKNRVREVESNIKTWSKPKKHMYKRFLPSSYKQEFYLDITSLSQKNLKVELQVRVGLHEDNKLTVARFIKDRAVQNNRICKIKQPNPNCLFG